MPVIAAAALAIFALVPPSAPLAPPSPPTAPSLSVSVAVGLVTNLEGVPLPGVLVQQRGAVTSAFTQSDGRFRLLLERNGVPILIASGVGYENAEIPLGTGQNLIIRLAPVSGFLSLAPELPQAPVGLSRAETAPLNSSLIFAYRLRQQHITAGGASLDGLINNDFRLGARVRLRPLLIEAEGGHRETPVDLAGLTREENPAFSPSTWEAGARVGLLVPVFHPDLELAALGAYRWLNTVPNNRNVPYTGSDLDVEQTRHALGGVGILAWRPWRGRVHLEGSVGLYPTVFTRAEAPGNPIGGAYFRDYRGILGFELMPGLRLGASYAIEHWQGASGQGEDYAQLYGLQLNYTPGGAPKGNEP